MLAVAQDEKDLDHIICNDVKYTKQRISTTQSTNRVRMHGKNFSLKRLEITSSLKNFLLRPPLVFWFLDYKKVQNGFEIIRKRQKGYNNMSEKENT